MKFLTRQIPSKYDFLSPIFCGVHCNPKDNIQSCVYLTGDHESSAILRGYLSPMLNGKGSFKRQMNFFFLTNELFLYVRKKLSLQVFLATEACEVTFKPKIFHRNISHLNPANLRYRLQNQLGHWELPFKGLALLWHDVALPLLTQPSCSLSGPPPG